MNVMRQCHEAKPNVPLLVCTKEISIEDVRLGLEKLPDRFVEHKNTVFVISNLHYAEAANLKSKNEVFPVVVSAVCRCSYHFLSEVLRLLTSSKLTFSV